jgi:hypothetical protein
MIYAKLTLVCAHTNYFRGMKTAGFRMINTGMATLERVSDELVEVRFKPGVRVDREGLGEVVRAKHTLCDQAPADILLVMPPEVDLDLKVLSMDHRADNGGCGEAGRLAFAAGSTFNEQLARIYFRYHPRTNETAVFLSEEEARVWLAKVPAPSLS